MFRRDFFKATIGLFYRHVDESSGPTVFEIVGPTKKDCLRTRAKHVMSTFQAATKYTPGPLKVFCLPEEWKRVPGGWVLKTSIMVTPSYIVVT